MCFESCVFYWAGGGGGERLQQTRRVRVSAAKRRELAKGICGCLWVIDTHVLFFGGAA